MLHDPLRPDLARVFLFFVLLSSSSFLPFLKKKLALETFPQPLYRNLAVAAVVADAAVAVVTVFAT